MNTENENTNPVNPDQNEAVQVPVTETPAVTISGEPVTDDTVVNHDLAPVALSNEYGDTQPNVPHEPENRQEDCEDKTSLPSLH